MLSETQLNQFNDYCRSNPSLFTNRVISGFFQHDCHTKLLLKVLNGNIESQQQLEDAFRKHYFRIRFLNYLVSIIRYCSIDQIRKYQKNNLRHQLIYDCPISENATATSIGDFYSYNGHYTELTSEQIMHTPCKFYDSLTNEHLADAFSKLTQKQKRITTLKYGLCYRDSEIAILMNVSPQAVYNMRRLALKKLRFSLLERGEYYG